jgi:hypothetical protein
MTPRLEEFLAALPQMEIPAALVPHFRAALEEFERSLGRAAAGRFSRYEINRFLTQRQRGGAGERELKNLTTACTAYLTWCDARQPASAAGADGGAAGPGALATDAAVPVEPAGPMWLRRHGHLLGLGLLALVLLLVGSCVAGHVRAARAVSAYSAAVRTLGKRTTDRDSAALRQRILDLAREHGLRVKPDRVVASVSDVTPDNMGRLPPSERMAVAFLMQQRAQAHAPSEGLGRRVAPAETELAYVEIDIIGEAPGVVGWHKFNFEHHLIAGAGPVAPPGP